MSEKPTDPHIFDVTTAEFPDRVLARSAQVPVIVDFWASWCAPCKMLAPLLEAAVREMGGRVLLAKVDTDQEPELAQRYRIRGIPTVMGFRAGQMMEEFSGARDARFVRAFVERMAPSETQLTLERGAQLLTDGKFVEAEALIRPLLAPDAPPGVLLLLADVLLALGGERLDEVPALLSRIEAEHPRTREAESVEDMRTLWTFFEEGRGVDEGQMAARLLADGKDHEARYRLAAALSRRGAYGEALEQLLELVSRSRKFREDAARKAVLLLFDHLGPDHELTQTYRRRLQVLL